MSAVVSNFRKTEQASYTFKCYWIYIIVDGQRQYTGQLDLKVIVEI